MIPVARTLRNVVLPDLAVGEVEQVRVGVEVEVDRREGVLVDADRDGPAAGGHRQVGEGEPLGQGAHGRGASGPDQAPATALTSSAYAAATVAGSLLPSMRARATSRCRLPG